MSLQRSSGVLLHPTSLPGGFGIGDLGPSAFAFIDLLAAAGQRLWQVLPLGPTGYGDSPYQCFSAFAGNPLLISLERLIEDGLLTESEAGDPRGFAAGSGRLSGRDCPPPGALAARAHPLRCGRWHADAPALRRLRRRARRLARRLRAVHGGEGRAWPGGLDGMGARHRATRTVGDGALVVPLRRGDSAAQADPVPVLRAVAARA